MKACIYKTLLIVLTASTTYIMPAIGTEKPIQVTMTPVVDVETTPYNAVGLLAGKRTFASAVVIENPRLILTTAPFFHNQTLVEYQWKNEWNAPPSNKDNETTKVLRRVWIFTGQRGYAAHWHQRTSKMRPGFALIESYENLVPASHVAKRAQQPYSKIQSTEAKKLFAGYPQKVRQYPSPQSITPLSRSMQTADLGEMPLQPLNFYRNQGFVMLSIASNLNTPDRFSGCEGGPLFIQNKDNSWEVAGIFSKEVHTIQTGTSTLLFRVLDEQTYKALIKPTLQAH